MGVVGFEITVVDRKLTHIALFDIGLLQLCKAWQPWSPRGRGKEGGKGGKVSNKSRFHHDQPPPALHPQVGVLHGLQRADRVPEDGDEPGAGHRPGHLGAVPAAVEGEHVEAAQGRPGGACNTWRRRVRGQEIPGR